MMSLLPVPGRPGSAACECARRGLSVLCIEEQGSIGYPVQCAGLLSLAAFEECAVSRNSILNVVTGAHIVPSAGDPLVIDAKIPKACVVDRAMLDREMAMAAADAGAEFMLKTSVCSVKNNKVITRGIDGHREIPFRILIAADGPRSTIARSYGMVRSPVYLAGIQAEGMCKSDPGLVELYPDASPEFFGWVIPTGNDRARVGLCGTTNVRDRFLAFVKRIGLHSDLHFVTGTIPLGVMPRTYGFRDTLCRGCSRVCQTYIGWGRVYGCPFSPPCRLLWRRHAANWTIFPILLLWNTSAAGRPIWGWNLLWGIGSF